MKPHHAKNLDGVITLVQEHRFRLRDDAGRNRLFVLAHDAQQEWSDLVALEKAGQRVNVRYTENDTVIACSAHAIRVLAH